MKPVLPIGLGLSLSIAIAGCSNQGTIASLGETEIQREATLDFGNLDQAQVRNEYEQLLDLVDDEYLKEKIKRRIAGVDMLQGDEDAATQAPRQGYYRDAIASYKDILEKYPNSPDNAEVLYQLGKAYDMEGQPNNAQQMLERLVRLHPYYPNISEAYFRLGDMYFGKELYYKAEQVYRETTLQDGGKLILNAHYMLGWALYKQGEYNTALDHFALVLNDLLSAELNGRKLSKAEKPLVDDTLHSMSLALVNLGGAKAIADIKELKAKPYKWRLFDELGQFYMEKSRFEDSAATYREFVSLYSMDKRASKFYGKLINAYVKGGFPKLILAEKENFVNLYGPDSDYMMAHLDLQKTVYNELNQYYVELSAHYHSQGQAALKKSKAGGEKYLSKLATTSLTKATDYYGRFINLFPFDKQVSSLLYKKADAHFENQQYKQAADDYELVAYSEVRGITGKAKALNKKKQSKAAYASLIALQKHEAILVANKASEKDLTDWRARSVESMLKFARVFHKDKRAIAVLSKVAQSLFELGQYERAIKVAGDLLKDNQKGKRPLNNEFKKTLYGILAHSNFQLKKFQLAQNYYSKQRKLVLRTSAEYAEISNQLAASIYKKAEQLKAKGQGAKAIAALLSIKKQASQSNIRVMAQFEAVSMMLEKKHWNKAIKELKQLNLKFPQHQLAAEFPRKLAYAYEQNKQLTKAAAAYHNLFKFDPDPAVQQEGLFIAAGLYKKLKKDKQAISLYRDYAHKYEQPFDNRMEARFNLASLYEKQKDYSRQLFWLRRIVAGDKNAGSQRTDRSQYLAAWANAKYGDYFAWEFNRRKLRLPLETSMAKKNEFLQDATSRYQQAGNYGILEFVSLSNYKMAKLYSKFSSELNNAPLPKGLAPEENAMFKDILSQQAGPFAELATTMHQNNVNLGWDGHYNGWIEKSFTAMKSLTPERYGKEEAVARYGDEIR